MSDQGTKIPQFILNLENMLSRTDLHHAVRWQENGKYICICSLSQFQQFVLPLYFRHSKYSSFVRQLNIYGFKKCKTDSNKGALFHHQHFSMNSIDYKTFTRRKLPNIKGQAPSPQETIIESVTEYKSSLTPISPLKPAELLFGEEEKLPTEDEPTISELIEEIQARKNEIEVDELITCDLQRIINEPKYRRARPYYAGLWNSSHSEQLKCEKAENYSSKMEFII